MVSLGLRPDHCWRIQRRHANGGDWHIRIRELTYGMDRAIGDHRVGLSLGFATDKADNDAFRVKGRHYTLAGYGAYTLSQGGQWHQYLHGVLGIGWLDSDIRRTRVRGGL